MTVAEDAGVATPADDAGPATRRLRILLASDYYPPFIGGVQRQIQLLGRELSARGHTVEVATVWSPGCSEAEDDGDVRVNRLRQIRSAVPRLATSGKHHPPPFADPVTTAGLRRVIARFAPDVIHSYGWFSYSCAAALTGSDIPLVLSARDYGYSCAIRTLVSRGTACPGPALGRCLSCASDYYGRPKGLVAVAGVRASRRVLRRKVSAVHSISEYVRDIVRRDFMDDRVTGTPHVVLPSFGDEEDRTPTVDPVLVSHLEGLPAEPFILFVGALRREKGIEPLLEAHSRLVDPPPLVLVGTMERDTPAIPERVVVLQDLPHAAVMAAWRGALFGVAPSIWAEPLGSVVYEGMSMGRAMIGTVPGGHADMIDDGVTGRLVPAGDAEALRLAMSDLIDDPELCRRYGAQGEIRSRRFTAAVVVPGLEDLYVRLVDRAP